MAKEKNGLRLVNGLRDSLSNTSDYRSSQTLCCDQHGIVPYPYLEDPRRNIATGALTAMERRVAGLLEDRVRIGRDLHDCILQSVYAIGLNLEASRAASPHQFPESNRLYDRLVAQLNHLIQEVRTMIQSLENGTIREFDLASELISLQRAYEQAGRLRIKVDLQPKAIEILTNEEEQEILNIVREGLSNCARHADAAHVTVALSLDGSTVGLSIIDDGNGFTLTDNRRRGCGLANMEARARKLGGQLRVHSAIGRGTTIAVEFGLGLLPADL